MLRPAVRLSGAAGIASVALLGALFLARGMPAGVLWSIAYACVGCAMLCVAGFAWIALTLPRGAPWRRKAMLISGGVTAAVALAALL